MKFKKIKRWADSVIAALTAVAAVSIAGPASAQAAGTTYYVNNASGSGCSDSGPGTITAPWCTFTPANALAFGPGDQLLLASGDTWDQQLTLNGAGSATDPAVHSSYGSGARPKILPDGLDQRSRSTQKIPLTSTTATSNWATRQ